jgi:hypothetical protein
VAPERATATSIAPGGNRRFVVELQAMPAAPAQTTKRKSRDPSALESLCLSTRCDVRNAIFPLNDAQALLGHHAQARDRLHLFGLRPVRRFLSARNHRALASRQLRPSIRDCPTRR